MLLLTGRSLRTDPLDSGSVKQGLTGWIHRMRGTQIPPFEALFWPPIWRASGAVDRGRGSTPHLGIPYIRLEAYQVPS
mgnify:CR=1 FL=1